MRTVLRMTTNPVDLLWAPDAADRSARIEKAIGNPAGRDPEMLKARMLVGGAQEMIDQVGAYAEAGVQQVILHVPSPYDLEGLEHVARDVLPAFR